MLHTRSRWSDQEWDSICRELYQTTSIALTHNVDRIRRDDVINAMHAVIDKSRWHASMNMTQVRPKLETRFAIIRKDLKLIEQEQKERSSSHEEIEKQYNKMRSQTDAFAPLVGAMAERLFSMLEPMLERYVEARVSGASKEESRIAAIDVHRPTKEPKLRIGVLGLIPIQEQEVIKKFGAYPFIELNFYDKERGQKGFKPWSQNLDMVFILTAKVHHGYESQLQRFTRVSGRGTTAMIRAIEIWLMVNHKSKIEV